MLFHFASVTDFNASCHRTTEHYTTWDDCLCLQLRVLQKDASVCSFPLSPRHDASHLTRSQQPSDTFTTPGQCVERQTAWDELWKSRTDDDARSVGAGPSGDVLQSGDRHPLPGLPILERFPPGTEAIDLMEECIAIPPDSLLFPSFIVSQEQQINFVHVLLFHFSGDPYRTASDVKPCSSPRQPRRALANPGGVTKVHLPGEVQHLLLQPRDLLPPGGS